MPTPSGSETRGPAVGMAGNLTTQDNPTTKTITMTGYIKKAHGQVAVCASERRSTRTTVGNARLALRDTDWSWAAPRLQARGHRSLNHYLKIEIALCVVLGASFLSFGAPDNPAQAAARAALEQILKQPDAREPQPITVAAPLAPVAPAQPSAKPVASVAGTVSAKVIVTAPPTVPVPTTRVAEPVPAASAVTASVAVAPAAVESTRVAPTTTVPTVTVSAMTVPARSVPVMSLLLLSFLIASLFAVMFLLLKLRQMRLKLRQLDSRF
jgi:hypothetical protein